MAIYLLLNLCYIVCNASPLYIGPLVCSDPSCPSPTDSSHGRPVNNSNFHLRDVSITSPPDTEGWYYLTGTSNSAGDKFWSDVWGIIRVWRSKTPLIPGSFEGGRVVFNLTRDCKFCGPVTPTGGCRVPNTCGVCGIGHNDSTGCIPARDCGGRVWAPELHYLPNKAVDVPGSGGWFISFHFHCAGGGSGLLRSTSGNAFGPYTDLVHGVPGGDVSIFQDTNGDVYSISSGSALVASKLSKDMTSIEERHTLSPECGSHCEHSAIGFEGPFVIKINDTYFLSSSAFGNATAHGGPRSSFNDKSAPHDSHYSSFMGASSSFLGPYTNAGQPGSWLALDNGGHNTYFAYQGAVYGTLWYGSEPNDDVPTADKPLVDLPSVSKMALLDGRLVQDDNMSTDF